MMKRETNIRTNPKRNLTRFDENKRLLDKIILIVNTLVLFY